MSRPPWGKVAPTGDGRGELALKPRLPPNLATKPNSPRKQNRTKSERPYTPASELPPPSPNGPTSHPKGEAKLLTAKPVQNQNPSPLGEGGADRRRKGGTRSQS